MTAEEKAAERKRLEDLIANLKPETMINGRVMMRTYRITLDAYRSRLRDLDR